MKNSQEDRISSLSPWLKQSGNSMKIVWLVLGVVLSVLSAETRAEEFDEFDEEYNNDCKKVGTILEQVITAQQNKHSSYFICNELKTLYNIDPINKCPIFINQADIIKKISEQEGEQPWEIFERNCLVAFQTKYEYKKRKLQERNNLNTNK